MSRSKIKLLRNKHEKSWDESYDVIPKIINKKKYKVIAEIGVAFGGHANSILQKTNVKKLYCVDPYIYIDGYDDSMNLDQKSFDNLFLMTKERLNKFKSRVKFIRKFSDNVDKEVKEKLDCVYIDADHSYEGVRNDLRHWFFKVRDGGVISGHDYGHSNFPGVKKAVDEFFTRFNWKIHTHESGVWWVEKKAINISFIIPAYNAEDTIRESIESIFKENFESGDELVVVDDYSTDKTSSVVGKLLKKRKEIKLISHSYNRGGGAARNTAVDHSKNELIFCLDSDNILEKNSIKRLKDYLIKSVASISSFREIIYFKKTTNKPSHSWIFDKKEYDAQDALMDYKIPGASGNYMFTRVSFTEVGGYPEFSGALDSWGLGFRFLINKFVMTTMPNSYYFHRIGHDSYWIRESKNNNTSLQATQIILPHISELKFFDRRYILGRGLYKWFSNLEKRPIHLKKKNKHKDNYEK